MVELRPIAQHGQSSLKVYANIRGGRDIDGYMRFEGMAIHGLLSYSS